MCDADEQPSMRSMLPAPHKAELRERLFTLAEQWAQQCYWKGLGRLNDIDGPRREFERALDAALSTPSPPTQQAVAEVAIEPDYWSPLETYMDTAMDAAMSAPAAGSDEGVRHG